MSMHRVGGLGVNNPLYLVALNRNGQRSQAQRQQHRTENAAHYLCTWEVRDLARRFNFDSVARPNFGDFCDEANGFASSDFRDSSCRSFLSFFDFSAASCAQKNLLSALYFAHNGITALTHLHLGNQFFINLGRGVVLENAY